MVPYLWPSGLDAQVRLGIWGKRQLQKCRGGDASVWPTADTDTSGKQIQGQNWVSLLAYRVEVFWANKWQKCFPLTKFRVSSYLWSDPPEPFDSGQAWKLQQDLAASLLGGSLQDWLRSGWSSRWRGSWTTRRPLTTSGWKNTLK